MILGKIDIRVMTLESNELTADELVRSMRHHYMLLFLAVTWVMKFPIRYRADSVQMGFVSEVMLYAATQVAATVVMPALLILMSVVPWRRTPQPIYLALVFFLGWFVTYSGAEWTMWLLGLPTDFSIAKVALWALLMTVLSEVDTAFIVGVMGPKIMADVKGTTRGEDTPVKPSPVIDMGLAAPQPGLRSERAILVADRRIPVGQILRISVDGNYVEIFLKTGRVFLAATMRGVLEQLNDDEGSLIHRSLWISNADFESYRREGMELFVRSSDGQEFRVARSRHTDVLPWLKSQSLNKVAGQRLS